MIDHLRQIAVFAKTVELGSFRKASKELRISPSVVSHHISQLEQSLGVSLLYRSTRSLSLTREGEKLYASAQIMMEAAEKGIEEMAHDSEQPNGELHITLPAILAQSKFIDYIAGFRRAYPKVRLLLDFSDKQHNTIHEGIDLAIRMGSLKDSSLKAKKLCEAERILISTEEYIRTRPPLTNPLDLENWDWLTLEALGNRIDLYSLETKLKIETKKNSNLSVTNALALYELVKAGIGVAEVPSFIARSNLEEGSVQQVLPEYRIRNAGIYAVWPAGVDSKTIRPYFVDFLVTQTTGQIL